MAENKFKLKNLVNFQFFDPKGAQDLCMSLGTMLAECDEQEAADWWFAAASVIASGAHPPHEKYESRIVQAMLHTANALGRIADRWKDAAGVERLARQKDKADAKAKKPAKAKGPDAKGIGEAMAKADAPNTADAAARDAAGHVRADDGTVDAVDGAMSAYAAAKGKTATPASVSA